MMEQILLDHGYLVRSFTSPQKAVENIQATAWSWSSATLKCPHERLGGTAGN